MEHALLIAEKVATALDHAYNTTIDGDRTLHGLVWPGFVAISDDGEVRLSGFGLASGVLPALRKPRLASDVAPYLAPEERERNAPGKNSDVYSVGVILLELLTLEPPPADPLATVKGLAGAPPPPVAPEILSVLRMALAPADTRYKSSGDLRRELGKLLFSGPYSPSTFNLAYFLHELFRGEIEAETTERLAEGGRSAESATLTGPASSPERASTHPLSAGVTPPSIPVGAPSRRGPLAAVGAILAAAAIAGGVYVVARKPAAPAPGSPAPAPGGAGHADPASCARGHPRRADEHDVGGAVSRRGRSAPGARGPEAGAAGPRPGPLAFTRLFRRAGRADGSACSNAGSRRARGGGRGEARTHGPADAASPAAEAVDAGGRARRARRRRHAPAHRARGQARISSARSSGAYRRHRRAARARVGEGRSRPDRGPARRPRGPDRVRASAR